VKVDNPTIFFRPVRCFGAAYCRLYASARQLLSDPPVEEAGVDVAQRWSLRSFEKDRRDEGRRAIGCQVNELGAEPKAVSTRTVRAEDLSARFVDRTSGDRFNERVVVTPQSTQI